MNQIHNYLSKIYSNFSKGIFLSGRSGYWSNFSKDQNKSFFKLLKSTNCRTAIDTFAPKYKDMIFSEHREAALELLCHDKKGICIDYGAMWGVLTFGMAKRGHQVIAVDKTYDSLKFIYHRMREEKLENIFLVQDDLNDINFSEIADFALVNGVLEWIPEKTDVVVDDYYEHKESHNLNNKTSKSLKSPKQMQLDFLKKVFDSLKSGGKLLLSIENRYNYEYFLGKADPHSNILYTSFLPRKISNLISRIFKKKDYRTYIYSFAELKLLLKEAGFSEINDFCCFPHYHFPSLILPNSKNGISDYDAYENKDRKTFKQKIAYKIEIFLMKFLKARNLCPSIIIVATK